jgi:predicted Ser/Thr protein kinase
MDVTEQHSDDGLIAGRYRVVDTVGQGGMGRVRRAEDPVLRRDVALKEIVLPPRMGDAERAHLLDRIRREARIAAQLNHPGIVRVHDIVEHDGDPVIVMEYLDGRSLGTLIRKSGPMDPGYVAQIAAAVADALAHAHAAAVVHRDLKPDNIVLTRDGRTVITDFGIARTLDDGTPLTMPGAVIGTPAFMAPEQVEGKELTAAADLWSLGATLYAALEGHAPFEGDTITEVCVGILTRPTPEPRNAGALAPLLEALLTKDPAQRATSRQALEFLNDLQRVATRPTGQPRLNQEQTLDADATTPDARSSAPDFAAGAAAGGPAQTTGYRGPCLGVLAAGVAWIVTMALPMWNWPLPSGSDTLSGWGLLFGNTGSIDAKWVWYPAVAVFVITCLAGAALLPALGRFRSLVCRAAIPIGAAAAVILLTLGAPGNPTHFSHCVADQTTFHLSVTEIEACINASSFGIDYYLCIATLILVVASGLWAIRRPRTPRASQQASLGS